MEAKEKLLSSTSTFFLEGWVPAEQLSDVEHLLSQYSAAWEATDPEPDEYLRCLSSSKQPAHPPSQYGHRHVCLSRL